MWPVISRADRLDAASDTQSHGSAVDTSDLSDLTSLSSGKIDVKQMRSTWKLIDWAMWQRTTRAHDSLYGSDVALTTDIHIRVCPIMPSTRSVELGISHRQVIPLRWCT